MTRALLNERQVVEQYQLSHVTLWKARREGRLRALKFGRSVRYDPADLKAFVDAHREGGSDAA